MVEKAKAKRLELMEAKLKNTLPQDEWKKLTKQGKFDLWTNWFKSTLAGTPIEDARIKLNILLEDNKSKKSFKLQHATYCGPLYIHNVLIKAYTKFIEEEIPKQKENAAKKKAARDAYLRAAKAKTSYTAPLRF